jgi:Zn-dependent protease
MRGAFQIARLFDIPVRIHWSFLLLLAYVAFSGITDGGSWSDVAWSFLFVGAIFLCVVLHEFGHALSARRFGVETKDIILSPIGGVARLYRMPEQPAQELIVAIAGPLVNVVIALMTGPLALWLAPNELRQLANMILGLPVMMEETSPFIAYFLPALFLLNIVLALFNLLPAFPMDGGRVLRALLSMRFSRLLATRIASLVGQVIALALFAYALSEGNLLTSLVGVFVFFMAMQEYRQVKMQETLNSLRVEALMEPAYGWVDEELLKENNLTPDHTLREALDKMHGAGSQALPVFSGPVVIGVIRMNDIYKALKKPPKR